MQISVNNNPMDVEAGLLLIDLLDQLNVLDGKNQALGIALAINNKIISRSNWSTVKLQSGDDITMIKATAGG